MREEVRMDKRVVRVHRRHKGVAKGVRGRIQLRSCKEHGDLWHVLRNKVCVLWFGVWCGVWLS